MEEKSSLMLPDQEKKDQDEISETETKSF
jgi:hypothetical protein